MVGPAQDPPRLELRGISKRFEAVQALTDVSFALRPGEVHALVGENGAGKSTLVGIVTGLRQPDTGEVLLDGTPVEFRTPLAARAAGVAAVYQDPNLFPHLSVAENIFTGIYPLRGRRLDRAAMRRGAQELLARLGMELDPDALIAGLTVAEAQFVEIARALSSDLRLLIMDEPTSALTPAEASRLYDVVGRLTAEGTTVVWISHRMEEIRRLATTVTVLRDGRHVRTAPAADITDDEIIRLMVGRSLAHESIGGAGDFGPPRLQVKGLGSPGLFADVSFEVRAGEILAVAGLVGAGRSEIAQSIFGSPPPSEGEVLIDGRPVHPRSPRQMSRVGVAYLPEDRDAEGIISAMSVTRNVALPSTARLSRLGVMRRARERMMAARQRDELSIKATLDLPVSTLSGGNRQKVALARWLATAPAVLMLDEPTHGIDVGTKAQVHDIMRRLAREERLAILMISSDLPEVLAISDRVMVVARGRVIKILDTATATQEMIMAAASPPPRTAGGHEAGGHDGRTTS
ncbi:MAG TPA: sugar ABC transporter ATP-binding protein [Thermopolyspora sp.]